MLYPSLLTYTFSSMTLIPLMGWCAERRTRKSLGGATQASPPLRLNKRKRGLCPRLPRVQVVLLLAGKRIDAHPPSRELQARNRLLALGRPRRTTRLHV